MPILLSRIRLAYGLLSHHLTVNMKAEDTTQTKTVTVRPENIIHIPSGLFGFESIKEYVLLSTPEEEPFDWLQVVGDKALAFLVVSPFEVLQGYQPNIATDDIESLGIENSEDALIYTIVTLRPGDRNTVNLKGPIVINRHTLIGKQIVIVNASEYPVQYPLSEASSN